MQIFSSPAGPVGPTFSLLLAAVTLFAPFFNPALTFCHLLRVRRRWNLFAHAQPKVFLCKVFQGHGFASDWEYEEAHGEDTEGIVARVAHIWKDSVGNTPTFVSILTASAWGPRRSLRILFLWHIGKMATNFHIRYTCKLKWKWRIYSIFLGPLGFSGCLAKCAAHLLFLRALGLPHIKKSSKQSCETKHHRSLLGQSVANFLYNVDDSRIHVYFIKKKWSYRVGNQIVG